MRRTIFAALILAVPLPQLAAQALMTGVVRDTSGRELVGTEVRLEGTRWQTRTDSSGRYRINAEPETYTVVFRQLGYGPLTRRARLTRGATVELNATLTPGDAVQLDTVEVRALRPRGIGREAFEERRALGLGKFIDSTVLRRSEGRRLSELLRETGVRMWTQNGGRSYHAVNPTKSNMDGSPSCYMSVFIDGVTYYRTGSTMPPPDLTKEFSIMALEGIEVYRGSGQIPMEFAGRGAECGIIVLWTRRGK